MSLYGELTRRAALRVAAAWIIIGWLLLQLSSLALDALAASSWISAALSSLLVLGFVPAVALAWILDTGHSRPSGRLEVLTILAMMAAIVLALGERLLPHAEQPPQPATVVASVAPAAATPEAPPPIEIPPGSIAVLPFENRSAIADSGYFVDGIHDDLLGQLARLSALKVISRTSVMEYRDSNKPLAQIGQELGVATILEASVQRAGDRVRISAQLAEAATGKHLWGASYDRELSASNVFEIQSEIARAIAKELITTLSPAQVAALDADPHTTDQQAYDLYLQARATGAESIDADILRRRALYQQAVALDPQFALALGELGIEYTNHYWFVTRDPADRDEGRRFIDRAIALAPDEPRLQYLLARHLYHGHLDYAGALAVLERAEQGMPNGAEIFELRAWILRRQGRLQESLEANERAIRLDPRNPYAILEQLDSYAALGDLPNLRRWTARLDVLPALNGVVRLLEVTRDEFYVDGQTAPLREQLDRLTPDGSEAALTELAVLLPYFERRYEAALSAADTLLAQPVTTQNRITTRGLQRALVRRASGNDAEAQANAAEALQELDAFLARLPNDPRAVAARAQALAILGRADEARAAALRATELYPPTRDRFSAPDYLAARLRTLALLGDSAELAVALGEYLALPSKVEHLDYLLLDPVFDRHREHPAVAAEIQGRPSS